MSSGKRLRLNTTNLTTTLGASNDIQPRGSTELDQDVPMPDALTPSTARFDGHRTSGHARAAPSIDRIHVSTSAPPSTANRGLQSGDRALNSLISKYTSAHARANQLRVRQATLKSQNLILLRHLTLQRSHLSFEGRSRSYTNQFSTAVADQLAEMEASHERFFGLHYSAICGLRRDEYRQLLLDYNHAQSQLRRLHSSNREVQYQFQQLILQMAVRYVEHHPVSWKPTQVPNLAGGPPPVAQYPLTSQTYSITQEAVQPPTKRARLPITSAGPTNFVHKQAQSNYPTSPPDLYYPLAPAEVLASNGEPSNRTRQPTSPSGVDGSTNDMGRSADQQFVLVEVATSIQFIEENIPPSDGGRKCAICGQAFLLSQDLTQANFQILSEHLRLNHFKSWEKRRA